MTVSTPGASGNLTLSVAGQPGYNGTVNFACLGLPLHSSCTINPSSVTGSGNTTVTIITTATHIAFPQAGSTARNLFLASGGLALGGVFVLGFAPSKRRWASLLIMLVMAWLLTLCGCGGSGGGDGSRTPGTLPGSYQVSVTGAGTANFKHQISFTVTVQ